MIALVDTGFLYALFDAGDAQHRDAVQTLQTPGLELLLPDTVIVELAYLLQARLGHARMRFYLKNLLADLVLVTLEPDDLPRINALLAEYADANLDFVDASIVALAERLHVRHILTVDRRDFLIVRPKHTPFFTILP